MKTSFSEGKGLSERKYLTPERARSFAEAEEIEYWLSVVRVIPDDMRSLKRDNRRDSRPK